MIINHLDAPSLASCGRISYGGGLAADVAPSRPRTSPPTLNGLARMRSRCDMERDRPIGRSLSAGVRCAHAPERDENNCAPFRLAERRWAPLNWIGILARLAPLFAAASTCGLDGPL
jgi:hypothetical protein